jgi:hypothetical protein
MNNLKIIGYNIDTRTDTNVVYAQINVSKYLNFIGDDFDKFGIQRKRESHKGYARLKNDIKQGAIIPPITLALKPEEVKVFEPLLRAKQTEKLEALLNKNAKVYILDGLQRTHIINDITEEGFTFNEDQNLLLEFWFEKDMGNLIYRLIVLNSGQKPMSMRHQVELLFMTMQDKLKKDIPGLIMYNEREKKSRDGSEQFPFDRIVSGYHSFLNESPEVNKGKLISEKLDSGKVITDHELVLLERYGDYTSYLSKYLQIDREIYRVYEKFKEFSGAKNWLADENVVNAFFAAIGILSEEPVFKKRIDKAIIKLLSDATKAKVGDDLLSLKEYDQIRQKFNPKQFNIGYITRKTVMNCFMEYFKAEGLLPFSKCWNLVNHNK